MKMKQCDKIRHIFNDISEFRANEDVDSMSNTQVTIKLLLIIKKYYNLRDAIKEDS